MVLRMSKRQGIAFALSIYGANVLADSSVIGQIYAPYVQPLEQEIEFVWVEEERGDGSPLPASRRSKLGYGRSIWSGVYTELAVSSIDTYDSDYDQIELEAIWQITDQGEFASDWGLLLEAETSFGRDGSEITAGVLNQRDFGRFSVITNAKLTYEWGDDVNTEFETALGIQGRYRWRRELEPTVELFMGQNASAVGPGATGIWSFGGGRQLRWNASFLKGLKTGFDYSVKLELEYEFF